MITTSPIMRNRSEYLPLWTTSMPRHVPTRIGCLFLFAAMLFTPFTSHAQTSPQPSKALQFIPVSPCRVADTRNSTGPFGGPEMSAGSTREFNIPQSACSIPSTAVAYSLNVTVVPSGPLGYLTVWPTGESQPPISTLNSDGRVKGNAVIVPAGTSGGVDVYVTDPTQVVLDINGYFVPSGTTSALAFYPLTQCRVVDTRNATGPLGGPTLSAGTSRAFPVQSSSCGIPSTAQAYSLNVTAVPQGDLQYLTTWPTGGTRPLVSTLNSPTGEEVANAAIVPAGTSGEISVHVTNASDVVLDIDGYFAPPGTGGLSLYTVTPCRVIDTRSGAGAFTGVLKVNVGGSTCAPPSTAQAYVFNATAVPDGGLNYLTLWPDGQTQPVVSTLSAADGAIMSNMAIVPTTDESVDAYSSNSTNLILDLSGYFAPPLSDAGTLTVSTTSLAFGDVVKGSSETLPVTLTASGTAPVTINSATINGAGFTVSGATFPLTLSPNQAVTLNVQFAPTAGGAVTGELTINSTSPTNPTSIISLSGTGSHVVNLAWQAPSNSPVQVTSYNIYRSSGSSSSYQMLSSTAQMSYVDSSVQSGTLYSYYIESVDSSGAQSGPSNSVTVTVPTP